MNRRLLLTGAEHLSTKQWSWLQVMLDSATRPRRSAPPGASKSACACCGRTVIGTLFFGADGRLTEFVAQRHAGSSLETWSVPITAYGEFEGLKLPVSGKAVWKLADGDQEYIDVTITELHHEH